MLSRPLVCIPAIAHISMTGLVVSVVDIVLTVYRAVGCQSARERRRINAQPLLNDPKPRSHSSPVSHLRQPRTRPQPSIFPAYSAPVIRRAADGERELSTMNWGFVLLQPGKAPRRVINVRDDKILTSKLWKPSFEARRCLVPASSYCEPNGQSRRLGIGSRSTDSMIVRVSRHLAALEWSGEEGRT